MLKLFQMAGIIAWPLGLFSILALGIIIERLVTLGLLQKNEDSAFDRLRSELERGDGYMPDPAHSGGAPVEQVMATLGAMRGVSEEALMQTAEIAMSQQRLRFRRYLGTLATIGSTAPFVGLFGTVLGVMAAFQSMSQKGLSGEMMASGISEALSATALGLLVAIPSVIAYNFFTGRVQGMVLQVHAHVARLIPLLSPTTERKKLRQEA